jgi:3-deoxy-D-manno-octulosonate 8-phosphate phosphatase (KDO 8-P phosphatase)
MINYKIRLNNINTFIFDMDGVLTNGHVIPFEGISLRAINVKDEYSIQLAIKLGFKVFVITGGTNSHIQKRLERLGVTKFIDSCSNKLKAFDQLKNEFDLNNETTLYMGDDIPDYQLMKIIGLAACPQDASNEIKEISSYQSPYNGGEGCVRDVIEQTLKVQSKWMTQDAFEW